MALDLAILSASGEPEVSVSLRVDEHHRLMTALPSTEEFLLRRLRDYYEDATYSAEEIGLLLDELVRVRALVVADPELTEFVEAATVLASEALRKGSGLVAIAD